MNLESIRLSLKEISWDDLENIHRLHSLPEVDEFNTLGLPKSIEETKGIICTIIEGQTKTPQKLHLEDSFKRYK